MLVFLLQNSIRHNLSLHSKFVRVQNEGNGKSSWWMVNPDAKTSKPNRRRSSSFDSAPKTEKRRGGRTKKPPIKEVDDESPSSPRLSVNRARDANRATSPGNVSPTNSSSSDSLLTIPESESPLSFTLGESFNRPRTSSNASTVSSLGGRLSPIPSHADELECEDHAPSNNFNMASTPNPAADEQLSQMANSMSLNSFAAVESNRLKLQPTILPSEPPHNDLSGMVVSNSLTQNITSSFDTAYNSGYLQPIQHPQQSLSPEGQLTQTISATRPLCANLQTFSPGPQQQPHFQRPFPNPQEISPRPNNPQTRVNDICRRDQEMEIHQAPENVYPNFQPSFSSGNPCVNGLPRNPQSYNFTDPYLQQQHQQVTPTPQMMPENGLTPLHCNPFSWMTNNNQFPSDLLELDQFALDYKFHDCDIDSIICEEMKMGDGGFDINFDQFISQMPNVELRSGLF